MPAVVRIKKMTLSDYFFKYFEPTPTPPSIEGRSDLPVIDRSPSLSPDELEDLRVGGRSEYKGWREPVKPKPIEHGNGPYPAISHYPSWGMMLKNVNGMDLSIATGIPLTTYIYYWLKYQRMSPPRLKYYYHLTIATATGAAALFGLPYQRLVGYARNDDEAERYLGWKKPIYYDSDLLLGIPKDIKDATVVTSQALDVPQYFSLIYKQ